ncbi:hypothetical protein Droror1_Dr00026250 [Drosera rotundifolia]
MSENNSGGADPSFTETESKSKTKTKRTKKKKNRKEEEEYVDEGHRLLMENPEIQAPQPRFAVDEQNKQTGTKMEFIKIVKAMKQGVGGLLYYLTIEVKDDVRDSIICQAKVFYSTEKNSAVAV